MRSVSVSIVTYNTDERVLDNCLRTLRESLDSAQDKNLLDKSTITIINNGKSSPYLQRVASCGVKLINNPSNTGYGAAHNLAIKKTKSDYHLIMNPDVTLDRNCIEDCLNALSDTSVALVGPEGETPNGESARLPKRFPSLLVLLVRGFLPQYLHSPFRKSLSRYEYHDLNKSGPREVELLSGCFMFCRADILKSVGGFDERYFLYFEDFDLSLRLASHGKVLCSPGLRLVHYGGQTTKKGAFHIWHFLRSAIKFFIQHRGK